MPARNIIFVALLAVVCGACVNPSPSSRLGFCYTTSQFEDQALPGRNLREGSEPLRAAHVLVARQNLDEVTVPSAFAECSEFHEAKAAWTDEEGDLVFVSAHLGYPERLMGPDVFDSIEGAHLDVYVETWRQRAATITLDDALHFAFFNAVPLDVLPTAGIRVWAQLPTTLPTWRSCETEVELALAVSDEDDLDAEPTIVHNGEVRDILVDGAELTFSNAFSTGLIAAGEQSFCPAQPNVDQLRWFASRAPF